MSDTLDEILEIARGDQFSLEVDLSDPDSGLALDLTGVSVLFTAKRYLQDSDDNAKIKVNINSPIPNPTLGIVYIPLTSANLDLPGGDYYYSIRLKYPNGDLITAIPEGGQFRIIDHATKRTS